MRNVEETKLAWALIDGAKPYLNARERNYVFVTVIDDTFAAIRSLIYVVAEKRIPLHPKLAHSCAKWLESYAFHDEYIHLRHLVEDYLVPDAAHANRAARPITASRSRQSSKARGQRVGSPGR